MPIDNVQRFERLCEDALYLQGLADAGAETGEVNDLTEALRGDIQYGFPVSITGGLIEVTSFNEELEEVKTFSPLEEEVSGKYLGLSWRTDTIIFPDHSVEHIWRLCHDVGGVESVYIDSHGDQINRTPISYITAEGSDIELMSPIGSHDHRRLALDGVSLLIDQIAMEENTTLDSKAERIARLFRIPNATSLSPDRKKVYRQRLSYLNEIGLFDSALVCTPLAVSRKLDGVEMLKTSGPLIMAPVHHVASDEAITPDGEWVDGTATLSYEVVVDQLGHLSIPHIPGVTRVYNLAA